MVQTMRLTMLMAAMVTVGCSASMAPTDGGSDAIDSGVAPFDAGQQMDAGVIHDAGVIDAGVRLSISGNVELPDGVAISSTKVSACVWNNGACEDAASVQTDGGTSFELNDLADGPVYFVTAWADLNSNSSVDVGDYFGVAIHGQTARPIRRSVSDANVTLRLVELQRSASSIPDGLEGTWSRWILFSPLHYRTRWQFRADGSATHTYFFGSDTCVECEVTTSAGLVHFDGGSMIFDQTEVTHSSTDSISKETETISLPPVSQTYEWRFGDAGTLFVTPVAGWSSEELDRE